MICLVHLEISLKMCWGSVIFGFMSFDYEDGSGVGSRYGHRPPPPISSDSITQSAANFP